MTDIAKKEEGLLKLKEKVAEKTEKFWDMYYEDDSMANDLLDYAVEIMNLQNGLIRNLEAKERFYSKEVEKCQEK